MSLVKIILLSASVVSLSACSSLKTWLPSSGPSKSVVEDSAADNSLIEVIPLNGDVVSKINASSQQQLFSEVFGKATRDYLVQPGDVLEIHVWEASPALLFGTTSFPGMAGSSGSRSSVIPEQMVNQEGLINVPFAGPIRAQGKTLKSIESDILSAIRGKANFPQVMVRMTKNTTSTVTVVGEVNNSTLLPLTPKGERVLDAIASAGGVKQPINKVTLQLSRESKSHTIPLETVIRDSKQNILLQRGDVLTAYFQPFSFTSLGASGKNEEIMFEANGITLAQALGRMGGLQDNRANAKGVFIFRFEDPTAANRSQVRTQDGKVPVIYQVDMTNPGTYFLAQSFNLKNKDVIYVSNAPAAELQKFLNIIVSVVYPLVNVGVINK